jgi:hypothetical protein
MMLRPGRGDTLVVLFHGAIDRDRRPVPFFQSFFDVMAPQISIPDPTLTPQDTLTTGWYLGREGEDLPSILSMTIKDVSAALGCTRRIYVGASAGGFAALNLAHRDSQGLAIAAAAQTNLAIHHPQSKVMDFLRTAWPSLGDSDPGVVGVDLGLRYGRSDSGSSAICIYSSGDAEHIHRHLGPFLSSLLPSMLDRFVLDVGYWGQKGHSGSVPYPVVRNWIVAALNAGAFTADALRGRYQWTAPVHTRGEGPPIGYPAEDRSPRYQRDIETARMLSLPVDGGGRDSDP